MTPKLLELLEKELEVLGWIAIQLAHDWEYAENPKDLELIDELTRRVYERRIELKWNIAHTRNRLQGVPR